MYNSGTDTRKFISIDSVERDRYKVNIHGQVYDTKTGKLKSVYDNGFGYKTVVMYCTLKRNTRLYYIHRVVAHTFIPNLEGKKFVNHKDLDKSNNRLDNLEWVTASQNTRHGIKNGSINYKGRSSYSFKKLSKDDIKKCILLYNQGLSLREVGEILNTPRGTVTSLLNGRSRAKEVLECFEELGGAEPTDRAFKYYNNLSNNP